MSKIDMDKLAKALGGKRRGKIPTPKGGFFGAMKTARDVALLRRALKAKVEKILVLVTPQAVAVKEWGYVDIVSTKGRHITAYFEEELENDPHFANGNEFLPSEAQTKGKKFPKPGFYVWECIPTKHDPLDEWDEAYWTFEDGHWRKPLAEDKWPVAFRLPVSP